MMQSKASLLTIVCCAFLWSFGCSNGDAVNEHANNSSDTTGLPPVETRSPKSNYRPAFAGQTRIHGVRTATAYKVEQIANKLGSPFAIVSMPDGRLMITLKAGTMEIHDRNGALIKKITGFPAVVNDGQGGLLDVAFDPKFAGNHIMYWSYSE